MPGTYIIRAECGRGHKQEIRALDMEKDYVIQAASLLDGSARVYQDVPSHRTLLGKCGICGSQLRCTVSEEKDPSQVELFFEPK